jgi:molybdopterin molybdotransferase
MAEAAAPELDLAPALALLAGAVAPVRQSQNVPLEQAAGRILALDLHAGAPLPGEDVAAMDGYALRSADAAAPRNRLLLTGRVLAGQRHGGLLPAGACVRIMTGAALPDGCDAVVMLEHVETPDAQHIVVAGPVVPGLNRRQRGEHVGAGSTVLRAGRRLRSADLGLARSLGAVELAVVRALRVGVLSTGDELRDPPTPLSPGLAYDGNRPMIRAALDGPACTCLDLGICPDEPRAYARILERAQAEGLDALLVSGGAAQGDADIVRAAPGTAFVPLRLRPGRGIAWSLRPPAQPGAAPLLVLGLPGNPVAAFVLLHLLARPLLTWLGGGAARVPAPIALPIRADLRNRPGRIDMRRGRLVPDADGQSSVELLPEQGSAMIRTVCEADVLVAVGPADAYRAGERLPCYLLDALAAS